MHGVHCRPTMHGVSLRHAVIRHGAWCSLASLSGAAWPPLCLGPCPHCAGSRAVGVPVGVAEVSGPSVQHSDIPIRHVDGDTHVWHACMRLITSADNQCRAYSADDIGELIGLRPSVTSLIHALGRESFFLSSSFTSPCNEPAHAWIMPIHPVHVPPPPAHHECMPSTRSSPLSGETGHPLICVVTLTP